MLKLFPERADDLLNLDALPPTDKTELNYRTLPLSRSQEVRFTLLILLGATPVALLVAVPTFVLTASSQFANDLVYVAGPVLVVWLIIRRLMGAIFRWEVLGSLLFFLCSFAGTAWDWAMRADVWCFYGAIALSWLLASLIGRQVAAWHLAAPTVDYERMQRWKVNLPHLVPRGWSLDCPELLTFYAGPVLIATATWIALRMTTWLGPVGSWAWPLVFAGSTLMVWTAWHLMVSPIIPLPNFLRSCRRTWQALVVFVSYDIHHTPAAGVFRFPTGWLRNPLHRWLCLVAVLIGISFGATNLMPSPIETLDKNNVFVGTIVMNFLVCSVTAPLVLSCSAWLAAGTLLDRFATELSELPEGVTEWDNYVDRIINSSDELEREHMLLGTSEVGDYPIMVHSEIHDQHAHILGDSGASKTALGIAPQVTQKIARGDSTVVVVDLKGDRALFETCRREAARTKKLRFRWLSNEVGKTTFSFNPFLQSHNKKLSVEQLTQQLLQGLSLDYGIQYGAGYFTAMNEIVLNNVMEAAGARSFLELSDWLSDRRWYASIGHEDDWRQARHLSALVKRLGSSSAVNVVPGMFPDQPAIDSDAIDVANLFEEPQVVYLWLRSAVEPTNAPAIARLFLWAMFTAASHQPQDKNRVYFFVDEMQQIISDGIKLIFEQFRDLGGTIIAAHQTAGQLRRQGTDLGDTIESCTAMKQVFRASDLDSLERLEKLSGTKAYMTPQWYQQYERGTGELTERYDPVLSDDGLVRLSEQERARFDRNELLAISSRRHSSLVRFTFGSGYTQFAGATVPIVSQYHISFEEYQRRRQQPWPTAPGAFVIQPPKSQQKAAQPETVAEVAAPERRPKQKKAKVRNEKQPSTAQTMNDEERDRAFISAGKELKSSSPKLRG